MLHAPVPITIRIIEKFIFQSLLFALEKLVFVYGCCIYWISTKLISCFSQGKNWFFQSNSRTKLRMNHVIGAGTQLLIGHILTKFGFIFSTHSSDSNQIPNNTVHWFFILLSSSFNIYYSKFFTLYLHYEITVFEFQKFGECIKCTKIGFQICGLFIQKHFSKSKFHADKQRTRV